uniref:Uncharacterized protein n=1 Tax=Arundo donax TaxID=35708 RepID=A0A0A9HNH6_ARUDO
MWSRWLGGCSNLPYRLEIIVQGTTKETRKVSTKNKRY